MKTKKNQKIENDESCDRYPPYNNPKEITIFLSITNKWQTKPKNQNEKQFFNHFLPQFIKIIITGKKYYWFDGKFVILYTKLENKPKQQQPSSPLTKQINYYSDFSVIRSSIDQYWISRVWNEAKPKPAKRTLKKWENQ